MEKQELCETDELNDHSFRTQFTRYVHEYCEASHNSFTLNTKKRDRVLKCLRNAKIESSARFRFWVRSKGFRIVQSQDGEDILAVPPKGNDPNDTLFRRVATIDEFFDIIYAAHSENGHVGQSQTFRAIKAMYALVPRILVIKFIEMCPQCSNTHSYAVKRRQSVPSSNIISADKLAGAQNTYAVVKRDPDDLEEEGFDESEEAATNQQEVANALNEILSGKIAGAEIETVVHIEEDDSGAASNVLFPCHLCKEVFSKKKALQKHIHTHQDFKPSVPLQKISPSSKKRKFSVVGFSPAFGSRQRRVGRQRIILDVDSSPTAAQAIVLAASRPDIELMAINCVAGRVSVLNACENALRVLRACGREDVHVCRGAEKSLLGLFGKEDNLPGIAWSRKVEGHVQAEHSVSSLIRCVNENPGEITLVCLGPLTNLALALRLDPLVSNHLKEVYIVGGNIEGQGDFSSCAEQNFLFDPEAAHIVLQEITDAIILPYEIGQRHSIPFKHLISCLNAGTEVSNFLIESVTPEELQHQAKMGVVTPEVFAVAMVIDSTIILEKEKVFATVELKGEYSRGLMVVDRRGFLNKEPNVYIVKNMDLGKTQALFGSVFSTPQLSDQTSVAVTLAGPNREHLPILFNETRMTLG
uniref:C2H2-type domain-containing protein n=1 Tax=Arion vulgaris TaxID=1028688 RepID=A0A0B6YQS7_9EUPU